MGPVHEASDSNFISCSRLLKNISFDDDDDDDDDDDNDNDDDFVDEFRN